MTTESVNDRQIGGKHYKSGYQHWDFVYDMGLDYWEGCATKYLTRRKGDRKEDLLKAIHFLEKRMTLVASAGARGGNAFIERFATDNSLTYAEYVAIGSIVNRNYPKAVEQIQQIVRNGVY